MNGKKIGVDIFLFLKKSDAFAVKQSNNNIDLTIVKKKMISRVNFEILTKTIITR